MSGILGIHHVTAIAADPQRNVDFYVGVLGLRMVKLTVNFDDPGSYHLYYGDELGRPGSALTFFSWPDAPRGRHGNGQMSATAFSVPSGALDFWREHLRRHGVTIQGESRRFGEEVLSFVDPDGLALELVASPSPDVRPVWPQSPIAAPHAIRGFYNATLSEEGYERTARLLADEMGFRFVGSEENRFRYETGDGAPGALVDVVCRPDLARGRMGTGTVHHIAWRVADDASQRDWRTTIAELGFNVSPILERKYFQSIYFREPGGVLFEIATDGPGFTVDEAPAALGRALQLPPWLESSRAEIERIIRPLRVPSPEAPSREAPPREAPSHEAAGS